MKLKKLLYAVLLVSLCLVAAHAQDDVDLEDELEDIDEEDFQDLPMPGKDEEELEEPEPKKEMKQVEYKSPSLQGYAYIAETFDIDNIGTKWIKSTASKDDTSEEIAKYDGVWSIEALKENPLIGDQGLVLKSQAKHHAIAANLDKPFVFKDKPFIAQYEVNFQNGQECGGAYVKLLTEESKPKLEKFMDKTPYTIMFGPDKCGKDNKLHFIMRHKNPVNGDFEEKHAKRPKSGIDTFFTDKKTHLFTLILNPDNTYETLVDQSLVSSGSLLEDLDPQINPPKEIVDPNDTKPKNWDEREKIADPDATKPDDWDESEPEMVEDEDAVKPDGWLDDESELIADPDAVMPSDWDVDMDGEWEAPKISNPLCEDAPGCGEWKRPQIKNPKYKGKWKAPMIDNPDYQGKWKPRMIDNPNYFEDKEPFKMTSIGAVGLELWSMSNDIYFDNFIITDDRDVADKWAAESWQLKHEQEILTSPSGKSVVQAVMDATSERPWLWAVFILVIVLPLVLIIAYCCMSGGSTKKDDVGRAKKTDEPSPDDEEDDDEVEDEDKINAAGDAKPKQTKKKASKSALDADEEDEADADAEEDEEEVEEKNKSRSSPRKRKNKPQKE